MTLPANLNVYVSAAMFVLGAYAVALYLGLVVWTFRDVRARTRDVLAQIMATLLVVLFTVPGLIVYLLLRPQHTLAEEYERSLTEEAILQDLEERRVCPNCQRRVEPDFIVCPYCHHQLRLRCVGCGRLLDPTWDVCPYCGLYREQTPLEEGEEESPPSEEALEEAAEEMVSTELEGENPEPEPQVEASQAPAPENATLEE
ncbi:MAG: zinc ribbon domain-containing protein [Anaerolineae bacterium]|nr:zinc ribbon domain-containing protein [Anaerolineae bacterium]